MKQYLFFECLTKEELDGTMWHVSEREILTTRGFMGGMEIHDTGDAKRDVMR